jgi:Spy/CpxP family protein refolding chaperone
MLKIAIPFVVLAGALLAQPPRPPMVTQNWWDSKIAVNSLNLTDAQTKQLTSIQNAYVSRLMDLRAAANKAESNLADVYNQTSPDELKAEAAIDQYANARDNLTRTLTKMSLQMRNVLTAEQWQELQNRQAGRASLRPGRGGGRRGTSPATGSAPAGSTANKAAPAVSQK